MFSEICARCYEPAKEYDNKTMTCYCHDCAVEIADNRWDDMDDEEKLDLMGFEPLGDE